MCWECLSDACFEDKRPFCFKPCLNFAILSCWGGGNSARAACIDGAQCSIAGGSQISQSGGHFSSTGFDTPAIEITGTNSKLTADNVVIDNGTNPIDDSYFLATVQIEDGGEIILQDSGLNAYKGVSVHGTDSRFSMLGGTMTIEDEAIFAYDNAFVDLDNVTIEKNGTQYGSPSVINIWQAGLTANKLVMNITDGDFETAIQVTDSQFILEDSRLQVKGIGMAGLDIFDNRTTHLNQVNLDIQGDSSLGIAFYYQNFGVADSADFSQLNLSLEGDFSTGMNVRGKDINNDIGQITISDSQFNLTGNTIIGIEAERHSNIRLDRVGISLTSEFMDWNIAILAHEMAQINAYDSTIKVENGWGVGVANAAHVKLDNSTVTTIGDMVYNDSHGLAFPDIFLPFDFRIPAGSVNHIEVTNGSSIKTDQGSAIWADNKLFFQNIVDVADSRIEGNRLAEIKDGSNLTLNASNAQLFGSTRIETDNAWLDMTLNGGTAWQIHPDSDGNRVAQVSILSLDDSMISFIAPANPLDGASYQTLRLGEGDLRGETNVYKAGNHARISFNSYLNEGGDLSNQFTDRLLINGDVSGITTISIREMTGSPGGLTSPSDSNEANEGISLIQVSGQAAANSFQLAGGYVTMAAQPYRYELFAYGPGASHGAADSSQCLLTECSDYWDFRLQSLLQPQGQFDDPTQELVPQAPNYLVTPLAMMQVELMDINNLHRRLGDIRSNMAQAKNDKQGEYFLVGYHGNYVYRANLSRNQYGYDADLRYSAAQIGGNLYGFESEKSMSRFGLSLSRGHLSLEPRHVAGSENSGFSNWNVAAYFTYLHKQGFYLDSILSFGGFGGDVSSQTKGKAAKMGGHSWHTSVEMGKVFMLNDAYGLEIEPQMQLIYQQLDFNAAYDRADDFAVALGRHQQFLLRLGSHLTKKFINTKSQREASIYTKLDYIHAFKDGDTIWMGDDFRISDFGNHIEAGLGFNALQSDNMSFYGEATWQQKIGPAGFSGIALNGGLRVQF